MTGHGQNFAGLAESQARLSHQLAAQLAHQCPTQLPSPSLQKAAELVLLDLTPETVPPAEREVGQLCGAAVSIQTPSPADEPDAIKAASRASCSVQVQCKHAPVSTLTLMQPELVPSFH